MSRSLFDVAQSIASIIRSKIGRGAGWVSSSVACRGRPISCQEMSPSDFTSRPRQGMDYGESEEVQKVHAAIQREKQEPRVGLEPLSLWLIGIYALAVFFGGAYLGRFSGSFSGDSLDPGTVPTRSHGPGPSGGGAQPQQELAPAERGKKVFAANCAVCHQASGLGLQSLGLPSLAGSDITNGGSRRAVMTVM